MHSFIFILPKYDIHSFKRLWHHHCYSSAYQWGSNVKTFNLNINELSMTLNGDANCTKARMSGLSLIYSFYHFQ